MKRKQDSFFFFFSRNIKFFYKNKSKEPIFDVVPKIFEKRGSYYTLASMN